MPEPDTEELTSTMPLLKWAGGKRRLLDDISPLVPPNYKSYYEPFLGGGAVFFAIRPHSAVLSDLNHDLINCYRQVRDSPDDVITQLSCLVNDEENYYRIRGNVPEAPPAMAARIIYLTTLSFNGIYRLNREGAFNVPYGYKTHIDPCDIDRIRTTSRLLQSAELRSCDFESVLSKANEGDLVYLDPPYTVAHSNNGFVKYNDKIFSWHDQVRLSNLAYTLSQRGCHVIVSNADHSSIRELYKHFYVKTIMRSSVMAASSDKRRKITECVFYNTTKAIC